MERPRLAPHGARRRGGVAIPSPGAAELGARRRRGPNSGPEPLRPGSGLRRGPHGRGSRTHGRWVRGGPTSRGARRGVNGGPPSRQPGGRTRAGPSEVSSSAGPAAGFLRRPGSSSWAAAACEAANPEAPAPRADSARTPHHVAHGDAPWRGRGAGPGVPAAPPGEPRLVLCLQCPGGEGLR